MFDIADENGRIKESAFMSSIKMWTDNVEVQMTQALCHHTHPMMQGLNQTYSMM